MPTTIILLKRCQASRASSSAYKRESKTPKPSCGVAAAILHYLPQIYRIGTNALAEQQRTWKQARYSNTTPSRRDLFEPTPSTRMRCTYVVLLDPAGEARSWIFTLENSYTCWNCQFLFPSLPYIGEYFLTQSILLAISWRKEALALLDQWRNCCAPFLVALVLGI